MRLITQKVSEVIVTVAYVGRIRWMPGTFGSLIGLLLMFPLLTFPLLHQVMAIGCLFVIAVGASQVHESCTRQHDSSHIVIDEVVGIWIALLGLSPYWTYLLVGFVFFRFFDILKPFPIGWVDQHVKGGLGVVLDDVLAGILANVFVRLTLTGRVW